MLRLKLILLLSTASVVQANSQEREKWKELILKVPSLDEDHIARINKQLSCFEAVHFSGYMVSSNCLLLKYNPQLIQDTEIISCTLDYLNQIPVDEIHGYTIFDVVDGKLDVNSER